MNPRDLTTARLYEIRDRVNAAKDNFDPEAVMHLIPDVIDTILATREALENVLPLALANCFSPKYDVEKELIAKACAVLPKESNDPELLP